MNRKEKNNNLKKEKKEKGKQEVCLLYALEHFQQPNPQLSILLLLASFSSRYRH